MIGWDGRPQIQRTVDFKYIILQCSEPVAPLIVVVNQSTTTKTVVLNQSHIREIETCQNSRPLLYSFIGIPREPFPQFNDYMESLHGKGGVHAVFQVLHYVLSDQPLNAAGGSVLVQVAPENQTRDYFYNLLMNSEFFAAPRGDWPYSVRFSEILSSGAIPVVFGDGWVLPYNKDVVDWSELAVVLPQNCVKETLDVIRAIPNKTRCLMRKKGLVFFQRYVADSAGRLRLSSRLSMPP